MMEFNNAQRASILVHALPYIQEYAGKIIVVQYGGNAMSDELADSVMRDIVLLSLIGVKVILVHGGSSEITDMLARLGKETQFMDGQRVTDKETVEVAQMVLAGKISQNLVSLIGSKGGSAIGLSGLDGRMITARAKSKALGFAGDIIKVNIRPIMDLLEKGYIPVITTLGSDSEGNVYSIDPDTAAARIAGEVGAESLIFLTDISGILKDTADPSTLIPEIRISEAPKLIQDGTIGGGMVLKVEACISAISWGVQKVFIIDGRVPHAILIETLTDEGIGTMFTRD